MTQCFHGFHPECIKQFVDKLSDQLISTAFKLEGQKISIFQRKIECPNCKLCIYSEAHICDWELRYDLGSSQVSDQLDRQLSQNAEMPVEESVI
mmetsp:Transcript_1331/g.2366  ORF Transcript_1331/g.2366 Transcript_1331/m.2366 type:complete len:94 (-) Transcript_1331:140-421(-)